MCFERWQGQRYSVSESQVQRFLHIYIHGAHRVYNVSNAQLTPIPNGFRSLNLNQTTPPQGPAGSASHVIFSEDGTQVLATVKGIPGAGGFTGFMAVWNISSDGTLSQNFNQIQVPAPGELPFSMTIVPGQNALLATDAANGVDMIDLSPPGKTRPNIALNIPNQGATCWSARSDKTGNFYVTDIKQSTVTEINVQSTPQALNASIVKVGVFSVVLRKNDSIFFSLAIQRCARLWDNRP